MVVVVSEEGTECDSRASVFQPMTPAWLVRYRIVRQHKLNLLPDWGVIAGVYPYCLLLMSTHHLVMSHYDSDGFALEHFVMTSDPRLCIGILSLLLVVVVVLTTTVLVLQPSKAKPVSQWKMKPKWRSLGEPFCPVECVCCGDRSVGMTAGIILCFIHVSGR